MRRAGWVFFKIILIRYKIYSPVIKGAIPRGGAPSSTSIIFFFAQAYSEDVQCPVRGPACMCMEKWRWAEAQQDSVHLAVPVTRGRGCAAEVAPLDCHVAVLYAEGASEPVEYALSRNKRPGALPPVAGRGPSNAGGCANPESCGNRWSCNP